MRTKHVLLLLLSLVSVSFTQAQTPDQDIAALIYQEWGGDQVRYQGEIRALLLSGRTAQEARAEVRRSARWEQEGATVLMQRFQKMERKHSVRAAGQGAYRSHQTSAPSAGQGRISNHGNRP